MIKELTFVIEVELGPEIELDIFVVDVEKDVERFGLELVKEPPNAAGSREDRIPVGGSHLTEMTAAR